MNCFVCTLGKSIHKIKFTSVRMYITQKRLYTKMSFKILQHAITGTHCHLTVNAMVGTQVLPL